MSHFPCLVIHKNIDDNLEDILEPYYEGLEVEPYVVNTKEKFLPEYIENNKIENPEEITDEDLLDDLGFHYSIDEDGNILTTYNPNNKWDWWTVGGRWDNYLVRQDGTHTNEALIKELTFAQNPSEKYRLKKEYEELVSGQKENAIYNARYYEDVYGDADTFAAFFAPNVFRAVVTPDGEWHEVGEMFWFGLSSESAEDMRKWVKRYYSDFIEPYMDYYATVVDMHI